MFATQSVCRTRHFPIHRRALSWARFLRYEPLEDRRLLAFGDLINSFFDSADPPQGNSRFGYSVGLNEERAILGVPYAYDGAVAHAGHACLFDVSTGVLQTTLLNPTPATDDWFGNSVGISGNVIVVGAPGDDSTALNGGIVYVFNATTHSREATIENPSPGTADYFGWSVAVSGDIVVVGGYTDDAGGLIDSGSVYLFSTDGAFLRTLPNPNPTSYDYYGFSVAISGNTVVVGAIREDIGATDAGAVYEFNATTGDLLHTLANPNPAYQDYFGYSVAVEGNTIVTGTPRDDVGATDSGAAYVYDAMSGGLLQPLEDPSPEISDYYGYSVAVSGATVVVGESGDNAGAGDAGVVHIYDATSGTRLTTLLNPIPGPGDYFGNAVAVCGNRLLAGAYCDSTQASYAGAGYLFDVARAPTGLTLDNTTVPENMPMNTVIGTFSTVDPNLPYDSHTYALVSGDGDADNASFSIVDNRLRTNSFFDFEARNTYSIRVRTTDAGGLYREERFAISVSNVNEAPVANGGGIYEVREGSGLRFDGSASYDPDSSSGDHIVVYRWDLDGDGVCDDVESTDPIVDLTPTQLAAFGLEDGPRTALIRLQVTDSFGETCVDTVTVRVSNAPPELSGVTITSPVNEEAEAVLAGSFFDASPFDSLTLTVGWGDGTPLEDHYYPPGTPTFHVTHVYGGGGGGGGGGCIVTVSLADDDKGVAREEVAGTWAVAASMKEERAGHTAAVLTTAELLVVGGEYSPSTAELYNPTFELTGSMNVGRTGASMVVLTDGRVLIAGGRDPDTGQAVAVTEIYDPTTGHWTTTGSMNTARLGGACVLLPNGKVAIFGGQRTDTGATLASTEVYDPTTGLWTFGAACPIPRRFATATVLQDGRVLVAGGQDDSSQALRYLHGYNFRTNGWDCVGLMEEARREHTATLLTDGRVLLAGGCGVTGARLASAELFVPSSGICSLTASLHAARSGHACGRLDEVCSLYNGKVLAVGGVGATGDPESSTEIFDPELLTWTDGPLMGAPRSNFTLVQLPNGSMMAVGGFDGTGGLLSTETLFNPQESNFPVFINRRPLNIWLSAAAIAENRPMGTTVGIFTTDDPDIGDHFFNYTLVAGAGGTDNGSFFIMGDQLRTMTPFDFETKNSYSIRLRTTDLGGLWFEKQFTVTVTDVNLAPTDLALVPGSVDENLPSGSVAGTFSSTDTEPPAGAFTYTLVAGTGDADNASFKIDGDQLKTAASFDFETKNSFTVRVRTTDAGGYSFEKAFTITVTNVDDFDRIAVGFGVTYGTWFWKEPGTWTPLHGLTPVWIVSGDLDGNGKADLVVNFGGTTGIWIYHDMGTWQYLHPATSSTAAMADIDGDNRAELILTTSQAGIAGVWAYDATLNTWSGLAGWQAEGFAVGDFDGNGKQDVAVDFGAGKGVWFWNNNTAWQYVHNVNPGWMAAGDLDGNGKTDLAVSVTGANDIWARLDSGAWQYIKSMANSTATAADSNGDGRAELFVSITDPVYAGLWEYAMTGSTWKYTTNWRPENLTSADVDGNGKQDIVADFGTNGLWTYKNDTAWQWIHSLNPVVMTGSRFGQALMADMAVAPVGQAAILTMADLDPILAEAKRRLALSGIVVALDRISVELADLADGVLGEAIGNRILIDRDAAGYGWFVDQTPVDDLEYQTGDRVAAQHMDLLTAVMHEMGHTIGLTDLDGSIDGLMAGRLRLGMRR